LLRSWVSVTGTQGTGDRPKETGGSDAAQAFDEMFAKFGYKVHREVAAGRCTVESDIEADKFLESIPDLQRLQIMNRDITQTQINLLPTSLEMAFALNMTATAIENTFDQNPQASTCSFRQYLDDADDLGHERKRPMFSYNFTRALNAKVNWDKFQSKNIMKVAPGFRFDPMMMQAVEEEATQ
jgi:hypothetical protein